MARKPKPPDPWSEVQRIRQRYAVIQRLRHERTPWARWSQAEMGLVLDAFDYAREILKAYEGAAHLCLRCENLLDQMRDCPDCKELADVR